MDQVCDQVAAVRLVHPAGSAAHLACICLACRMNSCIAPGGVRSLVGHVCGLGCKPVPVGFRSYGTLSFPQHTMNERGCNRPGPSVKGPKYARCPCPRQRWHDWGSPWITRRLVLGKTHPTLYLEACLKAGNPRRQTGLRHRPSKSAGLCCSTHR